MRPLVAAFAVSILLASPWSTGAAGSASQPWGYRVGEARPAQQGNFCTTRQDAMEVAEIFERFGARTGFSALSNAPGCSTRVHAVTPTGILRRVPIALESGGGYTVSFIRVQVEGGGEAVLITTRRLIED
jgi:hypothetical protein